MSNVIVIHGPKITHYILVSASNEIKLFLCTQKLIPATEVCALNYNSFQNKTSKYGCNNVLTFKVTCSGVKKCFPFYWFCHTDTFQVIENT